MQEFFIDIQNYLSTLYDDAVRLAPRILLGLLVLSFFYIVARWLRKIACRRLNARTDDLLLANFLGQVVQVTLIMLGLVVFLSIIGLGGASGKILAGAGVSAFLIGFAFKDIGENLLAGVMLAFSRPFQVGDTIEVSGEVGSVTGMTLRQTKLKTFNGKDVFIPNANVLKNVVVNRTIDSLLRYEFVIGLDYDDDLQAGMNIILDAVNEIDEILKDPAPRVALADLGESTVNAKAQFWMDTDVVSKATVLIESDAKVLALKKLTEAGYYLPAAIMEVKNYKDHDFKSEKKEKKEKLQVA